MTTDGAETLTRLVASALQPEGLDTLDTLFPRCVDPESGYKPSRTTVWKLADPGRAESVKINPKLVGAMAAGLGISPERAKRAAAYQFTGYLVASELGGATVLSEPGAEAGSTPVSRAVVERWDEEEGRTGGNHSA